MAAYERIKDDSIEVDDIASRREEGKKLYRELLIVYDI
jgi:L-amino acid N-acyltransferase YncA